MNSVTSLKSAAPARSTLPLQWLRSIKPPTLRDLWQSLGVPAVSIAIFMFAWSQVSSRIETSLGQIPGPVAVWQQMIASYFPNTGWLRLDADVLARVADYRAQHGLTSWEETIEKLLGEAAT